MKINRLILTGLIILLTSVPVSAATVSWNNLGGLWSDSTKWIPVKVPDPGDDVFITNADAGIITVSTTAAAKTLTVGGAKKITLSTGKLTLANGDYTSANIIYVADFYPNSVPDAFKTFLEAAGHTVTIILVEDIVSTDFSTANLIIVKTSALGASDWNGAFAAHAAALYATQKPILNIYLGDYLFDSTAFNLFIGHGQSMSSHASSVKVDNAGDQFWSTPHSIAVTTGVVLAIYTSAQPDEIVSWSSPPATAHKFVTDPSNPGHSVFNYQLINSTRYFHWGTEGTPTDMTTDGQNLFLNVVYWMVNG